MLETLGSTWVGLFPRPRQARQLVYPVGINIFPIPYRLLPISYSLLAIPFWYYEFQVIAEDSMAIWGWRLEHPLGPVAAEPHSCQ